MFIFRPKYKDRNGEMQESSKWYVSFVGPDGIKRRLPAFKGKKASESFGRNLEELSGAVASRQPLPAELSGWLEGLPPATAEKLKAWGLLSNVRTAAGKTLQEHVEDWQAYLIAKGNTLKHANLHRSRVESIFTGCRFAYHGEISAAKVASFVHEMTQTRKNGKQVNVGLATKNHYLGAVKSFCTWMCKDGRASSNPVAYLDKLNAATDVRRKRRVLESEEIEWLLNTTEGGPVRQRLTGPERCLLYHLALGTGLRTAEIQSLRRESFNLAAEPPVVVVAAGYSKHKRGRYLAAVRFACGAAEAVSGRA